MLHTRELAKGISLRSVYPEARFFGGDDVRVTSCSSSAPSCRPGDVFVSLYDPAGDEFSRVQEAIQRGASAIVTESMLPVSVFQCVVSDTREAYGRLCQHLAGHPTDTLQVVGVTGSDGKTTTSLLIASILRAAGRPTGFTTSLLHSDGDESIAATRTTPAPPSMANWLTRMVSQGCTHGVLELSSRALAERRAAGINLDAAVITNLRRDHVNFHGNLDNYRSAKRRVFEQLKDAGFGVLNADDPGCQLLLKDLDIPVITFGLSERAEVTGRVVERFGGEQTFLLTAGSETIPVRTRIIGDHHLSNCLAAAAAALVFGIDLTVIARGLEAIERIPNRMDRIECGQPFNVFVDCADTPQRLTAVLQAVREVTRGRVICAFGSTDQGDPADRPLLGRALERRADVSILTSGSVKPDAPLQLIHDLLDGYRKPARAHVMPGRTRAVLWAMGQAQAGDSILIAGSDRRPLLPGGCEEKPGDLTIARDWLYRAAGNEEAATFRKVG